MKALACIEQYEKGFVSMQESSLDQNSTSKDVPDLQAAIASLEQSDTRDGQSDEALLDLIKSFRRGSRKELLDALLLLDLAFFSTVRVIYIVLTLADIDGRAVEFMAKFDGFSEAETIPPRWGPKERIKGFKRTKNADLSEYMHKLKYVKSPAAFDDIVAAAQFYTDRFDLSQDLVDALYERSTACGADKDDYARRLKQGFLIEHVLNDLCRRRTRDDTGLPRMEIAYDDLWREGAFEPPAMSDDNARRPSIFLTFHTGMIDHVKLWFKSAMEKGVRMGSGVSDAISSSRDNPNGALLEAYRAAMQGTPLLIAADSPMGTAKNVLSVLGRQHSVADGFVFLSFESRADVFWIVVVLEDGRLTPRIVRGPTRIKGEKIVMFRERMIAFVEEQLTLYLVGAPEQISLRTKWTSLMSSPADA